MKSCFKYVAGALAAMAFIQCASVQEVEPSHRAKGSFEVYASPGDTRTANDGLHTLWVDGDRFNLFHAAAGTSAYVSDGAFSIDDPASGHARGTVTGLSESTYDWLLVYPYTQEAAAPTAVPVVIGSAAGGKQVQSGKDSRVHLAGETFPVAGKAAGIPSVDVPVLTAAPLLSVIAVNVTNPGQGSVKVETVRFKAPEAVVGSFRADVTGPSPVFQGVDASDEAVLEVSGDNRLAAGESAVFFLGIKPFQAAAGSTLTLTVNDQTRTLTLPKATAFAAGKIKTLNITLDPSDPPEEGTYYFKKVSAFSPGRTYILVAEETDGNGDVLYHVARALPEGTKNAALETLDVTPENDIITLSSVEDAFTFYESQYGTLIRQADGRYLYNKNTNNSSDIYADADLNNGSYWAISFDTWNRAILVNRLRQIKYNPDMGKFQALKTDASGLLPLLYELQNSEDAVTAFLENTVPGVYSFEGTDWLYREGSGQTAVRTGSGSIVFRIYEPSTYTVIQVAGIPVGVTEGDRLNIRLARYVKQATTHASEFSVQAVRVADGKAWLMAGNGTGFIVQIQ